MIKKAIAPLLAAAMLLGLTGCGNTGASVGYVLVTNPQSIAGDASAAKAWISVESFAGSKGVSAGLFTSEDTEEDSYKEAMNAAVRGGAKTVVSVGEDMEIPVYYAQIDHTKTNFILVGGKPRKDADGADDIRDNTLCVDFAREQEGFLAGYAAVMEGCKSLAYKAGTKTDDAVKYEAGFVQGAEAAAKEKGLQAGTVTVDVNYAGSDELTPVRMDEALKLYDAGCEAIMTYGDNIRKAVLKAAALRKKYVISAGEEANDESKQVLMSTTSDPESAVTAALKECDQENFKSGSTTKAYGAKENCVGLALDYTRFKNFTKEQYSSILGKLADGSETVSAAEQTAGTDEVSVTVE